MRYNFNKSVNSLSKEEQADIIIRKLIKALKEQELRLNSEQNELEFSLEAEEWLSMILYYVRCNSVTVKINCLNYSEAQKIFSTIKKFLADDGKEITDVSESAFRIAF